MIHPGGGFFHFFTQPYATVSQQSLWITNIVSKQLKLLMQLNTTHATQYTQLNEAHTTQYNLHSLTQLRQLHATQEIIATHATCSKDYAIQVTERYYQWALSLILNPRCPCLLVGDKPLRSMLFQLFFGQALICWKGFQWWPTIGLIPSPRSYQKLQLRFQVKRPICRGV